MKSIAFALLLTNLGSFGIVTEAIRESCSAPERIHNAQPLVISDTHEHGFILMFKCQPGYIQINYLRMVCQDGKWSNLNIGDYCKPRPCESLQDPDNGRFHLTNHEEFVFGARVQYTCNEGYQMVGSDERDCRVDGWSGRPPFCEVKTCSSVNIPEDIRAKGIYDSQPDFPYGSVLQFECTSPNTALQGAKEIYCLENKTWSHPVPFCTEIQCEKTRLEFGHVKSSKDIFKNGEIQEYQCNPSYKPSSKHPSRCTKDGWIPEPLCSPITCQTTYIHNGDFEIPMMYNYQETVHYTCNRGYTPSRQKVTCRADGWEPVPTCAEMTCTVRYDSGLQQANVGKYQIGERTSYSCRECTYWRCQPDTHSFCTTRGWEPPLACPGSCSEPPEISHGRYNPPKSMYRNHQKVTYSCEDSYQLKGREEIQCINGRWDPRGSLPACIAQCPKPLEIISGSYLPKQLWYNDGAKVKYSCENSNRLQGSNEIQCQNGEWLIGDSYPTCIVSICSDPPRVAHATIRPRSGPYHVGDFVTYTCLRSYTLHGNQQLQCGASGWPQKPICFDYTTSCVPPPLLKNGHVTTALPYKIEYGCNYSFRIQGRSTIFCVDGNWTESPSCHDPEMKCDQPPRVSGGDFLDYKTAYDHGETRKFECQNYYTLEGPNVVRCIGGQWTPPPICHEPCVVNKESFQTNKVNLKWKTNKKLYVRHEEGLDFRCFARHKVETGDSLRQICHDGHITIPTCYRDRQTEDCFPLQFLKCHNCTGSKICVHYQRRVISVSKPDPTSLVLTAESGKQTALLTVTGISEQYGNNIAFSLKAATEVTLGIIIEARSMQFNKPLIGDYRFPFRKGSTLTFNVTFSEIFSIEFIDITRM
uniref:Complement factor H n=1 Tax=Callorhinchus milii TaxID=7868 RepID=V9K9Z8_CALMI